MSRTARHVAAALAVAVLVSLIAWPVYGAAAFASSLEILAPVGAATTLAAHAIAAHCRGLRRQLGGLGLLAAARLAAALALFALLMFVSEHDAFFMALAAGYAALVGLAAARLVARSALRDLDAVRGALAEVAEGAREVHIGAASSRPLAGLAAD